MEVPPSYAKMHLKSAPQKLNFSMAKDIQKCYKLNCSLKCPWTFPHSYALLRYLVFEKKHFIWNNIFYSLRNQKWDKSNSWYLEYIENKWGQVGQFCKFCLCQQLFAFKRFCMETRLSNILKNTNATKFTKTVPESTYKVVLDTYNLEAPTQPVSLLRAIDF